MKTIFITSLNPFIYRNIFESDVLKGLLRKQIKIIIFVPDYKRDFFSKKLLGENIIIEPIKVQLIDKQDVFFRYLNVSIVSTSRLKIRHRELLNKDGKILNFIVSRVLGLLSFSKSVKRISRLLDFKTINKNKYNIFFEKYKPDLVFATDVFHNDDVHLLAEAKHRGVKTVGMVRSWDNITNKGLFRIKPDKLIVHNKNIAKEAIKYEDMRMKDIFVSGIPQFDYYFKDFEPSPKEDFFDRIGLDPNKKTILIAPHGERFHHTDWQLLDILKKELPENLQFIVRFPPNDTVDFRNFKPDSRFFIEKPGVPFPGHAFKDNEVEFKDTVGLAEDLFHCDLVVNYGSTISIDASVFNKPVVVIAFDGWDKVPYIKSVRRFLDYDHIKSLVKTGFCKIAHNKDDLKKYISSYLENPGLDHGGRKKLLEEQVYKFDGESGKRIFDFIVDLTQ